MQQSAAPMQCQHCKDDQNFTIHAAPSLAHGAIEHQRRGCLHRCRSSRAPTMMNISPSMQRIAPRLQLPNTNAGACCLDTAAPNSNDEAVCFHLPHSGEKVAEGRMRGALRTAQTSRAWRPIVNTRIDDINRLRLRTQQTIRWAQRAISPADRNADSADQCGLGHAAGQNKSGK